MNKQQSELKWKIKSAEDELDAAAYRKYPELTEDEIKSLVVEAKWISTLHAVIHGEMDRISQSLTQRVKELVDRYETPVAELTGRVVELESRVSGHLRKMGFATEIGVGK